MLSTAFIKLFYKTLQHSLRQLIIFQQSEETNPGSICSNMTQVPEENSKTSNTFIDRMLSREDIVLSSSCAKGKLCVAVERLETVYEV